MLPYNNTCYPRPLPQDLQQNLTNQNNSLDTQMNVGSNIQFANFPAY
ncbi:MAG: hypothetical protein H0T62_02810 [Parachlamydiaceae bacterium]|nr:hypothetical protein [Parachlamydiaceae bacterium]